MCSVTADEKTVVAEQSLVLLFAGLSPFFCVVVFITTVSQTTLEFELFMPILPLLCVKAGLARRSRSKAPDFVRANVGRDRCFDGS